VVINTWKETVPLCVTIVITTYKRNSTLERAIISACDQDYTDIEIIVVDDNADPTWNHTVSSIIKKVETDQDRKIIYVKNQENKGVAKSRNAGITKAKGEYITFLDDDDVYLKSKVSTQLAKMKECDADFSITDMLLYDSKEKLQEKRVRNDLTNYRKRELHKYHILHHLTGNDTFMFKTDFIRRIGGYKKIDIGDDYYLIQKAILSGGKFTYLHECHVKAYLHTGEDGGLSCGQKKINGELKLQNDKKRYFSILTIKEKCYVWMRHYAVIAFAELRRKRYAAFCAYAFLSFLWNPLGFITMIFKHL
jgi:glycosyltransferase involved in cell wall biosynthesis